MIGCLMSNNSVMAVFIENLSRCSFCRQHRLTAGHSCASRSARARSVRGARELFWIVPDAFGGGDSRAVRERRGDFPRGKKNGKKAHPPQSCKTLPRGSIS